MISQCCNAPAERFEKDNGAKVIVWFVCSKCGRWCLIHRNAQKDQTAVRIAPDVATYVHYTPCKKELENRLHCTGRNVVAATLKIAV